MRLEKAMEKAKVTWAKENWEAIEIWKMTLPQRVDTRCFLVSQNFKHFRQSSNFRSGPSCVRSA